MQSNLLHVTSLLGKGASIPHAQLPPSLPPALSLSCPSFSPPSPRCKISLLALLIICLHL